MDGAEEFDVVVVDVVAADDFRLCFWESLLLTSFTNVLMDLTCIVENLGDAEV